MSADCNSTHDGVTPVMSPLDMQALRWRAGMSKAEGWNRISVRVDDVLAMLSRIESIESSTASIAASSLALVQRAETAEKERDELFALAAMLRDRLVGLGRDAAFADEGARIESLVQVADGVLLPILAIAQEGGK